MRSGNGSPRQSTGFWKSPHERLVNRRDAEIAEEFIERDVILVIDASFIWLPPWHLDAHSIFLTAGPRRYDTGRDSRAAGVVTQKKGGPQEFCFVRR